MFFEEVSRLTAEHLQSHIAAYLAEVEANFTGNKTESLVLPKTISEQTLVGGIFSTEFDELPAYSVEATQKTVSNTGEALFSYNYSGAIIGLVSGASAREVDRLAKRHAAAVELFVRRHEVIHQLETDDFRILDFSFGSSLLSGAEQIEEDDDRERWVDGFLINVSWTVSEDSSHQHA